MGLGVLLRRFGQSFVSGGGVAKMVHHSLVLSASLFRASHVASTLYVAGVVVVAGAVAGAVGMTTPAGAGSIGACSRTERTSHASSAL